MKKITQDFIKESIPYAYDINKLKELGFVNENDELNENYYNIYSLYKYFLEKTFSLSLSLDKIDNFIKDDNFNFLKVEQNDMDVYQYYSNMDLNYIYLRNNIFVENMNKYEIDFLLNKYNNNDYNINDEVVNFIKNSCGRIIKDSYSSSYGQTNVFYHPNNNFDYSVDNSCIVLGIRYNENNYKDDNEYIKKEKFIYSLIQKFNKKYNKNKIVLLRYNDFNIIKKKPTNSIKNYNL